MKRHLRALFVVILCGLSLGTAPVFAAINARLDRNRIGANDTVQLTLRRDDGSNGQPDLSPLKQDFDIVGRSSGSSLEIVNGKTSSQYLLTLVLAPKHVGKLIIPSLSWGGESSPPLSLEVDAAGTAPAPAAASGAPSPSASGAAPNDIFLTATPDQKRPYVQAAVALTVKLYTDQPLYQAGLDLEPSNDVLVQQIGKDAQSHVTRNGRDYVMVERHYLLFPQRSGHIKFAGPVLSASIADGDGQGANPFGNDPFFTSVFGRNPFAGMLTSTKPIRIHAASIVLDVQPRPAGSRGQNWLPAKKVTLEESWQPGNAAIHVGDPITRHLHLSAQGLTGKQLPDLSRIMTVPDGLRVYPDQAKFDTAIQGNDVVGTRDQDIALIADHAGQYVLPPLDLYWWDTVHDQQREATLPGRTLHILPASAMASSSAATPTSPTPPSATSSSTTSSSTTAPAASTTPSAATAPAQGATSAPPQNHRSESSLPWRWISLGIGLLWLVTLAVWLWTRRKTSPRANLKNPPATVRTEPSMHAHVASSASAAQKAFVEACAKNDPQAARRHLLDWASAVWSDDPPLGLMRLSARLGDPELAPLLAELDRACYTQSAWRGAALAQRLRNLSGKSAAPGASGLTLDKLYP